MIIRNFPWPSKPLGELCDISIGRTPSRNISAYWGPGSPWLSIADMEQGREISHTKETITDKAIRECNCRLVPAGTLLLSFKLSLGKVGFVSTGLYTNEAIAALPIKKQNELFPQYLYRALQVIDLQVGTDRAVKGATLNKAKLQKLAIPLPPLAEQKWIAAILDKADAIRRKRQAAIKLADDFLRATFLDMFGDPDINPFDWPTFTLPDLASKEKYSIKRGPFGGSLKKEIFVHDGYLVYEQFHAINDDFSLARYFITEEKYYELEMFKVKLGDLIISCSGVTLGRIAEIPENALPGIINQALLKLSLHTVLSG